MIILSIFILILVCCCAFLGWEIYKLYKLQHKETQTSLATDRAVSNLYELTVSQTRIQKSSREHHILCLGNSITVHPYKAEIGWLSEHGMAASRPEKDYCHILESKLKILNPASSVTGISIADWESNFDYNVEQLMDKRAINKDIIIIRIGENVRDVKSFENALDLLIQHCQQQTAHIIVTGNVWKNAEKESALAHTAFKKGLTYVPLFWIMELYPETYPQVGDTLYDTKGKPYTIDTPFITTHPNDIGMKMIAETIYNYLDL